MKMLDALEKEQAAQAAAGKGKDPRVRFCVFVFLVTYTRIYPSNPN
jgi:hypothetical protein